MQAHERAFLGFRAWQVYYRTHLGDILLPTGYAADRSIPAEEYLARQLR
jgi:hypothetical protein